jgi:hypothetical protein
VCAGSDSFLFFGWMDAVWLQLRIAIGRNQIRVIYFLFCLTGLHRVAFSHGGKQIAVEQCDCLFQLIEFLFREAFLADGCFLQEELRLAGKKPGSIVGIDESFALHKANLVAEVIDTLFEFRNESYGGFLRRDREDACVRRANAW